MTSHIARLLQRAAVAIHRLSLPPRVRSQLASALAAKPHGGVIIFDVNHGNGTVIVYTDIGGAELSAEEAVEATRVLAEAAYHASGECVHDDEPEPANVN